MLYSFLTKPIECEKKKNVLVQIQGLIQPVRVIIVNDKGEMQEQ